MRKNRYLLYAIALLQGMVFYGPIATLYRQAQGVTILQITLIESISLALGILLEVPWGIIADRIGYRRTMIFCSGLYFLSKLVFWQADGFAGFLLERIMLSVVLAGFSGVDSSILYLSCQGQDSQKAFGMYHSMSMAGLLAAAGTFSLLIQDNYSLAGLLTVVSYGLAALLSLGLTEVKETTVETARPEPIRATLQSTLGHPPGTAGGVLRRSDRPAGNQASLLSVLRPCRRLLPGAGHDRPAAPVCHGGPDPAAYQHPVSALSVGDTKPAAPNGKPRHRPQRPLHAHQLHRHRHQPELRGPVGLEPTGSLFLRRRHLRGEPDVLPHLAPERCPGGVIRPAPPSIRAAGHERRARTI